MDRAFRPRAQSRPARDQWWPLARLQTLRATLRGWAVRRGVDVLGRQHFCHPLTPPLMTSNGLTLGCISQCLGDRGNIAGDERDARRAQQRFGEAFDACLLGAEASQACSCTPCTRHRHCAGCAAWWPIGRPRDRYSVMITASAAFSWVATSSTTAPSLHGGCLKSCTPPFASTRVLALQRTPRGANSRRPAARSGEVFTSAGGMHPICPRRCVEDWTSGLRRATGLVVAARLTTPPPFSRHVAVVPPLSDLEARPTLSHPPAKIRT